MTMNIDLYNILRDGYKNTVRAVSCWKNTALDHRPKLLILLYHRILPKIEQDPLRIAVTLDTFIRQVDTISRDYPVISLTDALAQCRSGRPNAKTQVVFTFDDGYRDVYDFAFPFMRQRGIGGTIFLPVDYIGRDIPAERLKPSKYSMRQKILSFLRPDSDMQASHDEHNRCMAWDEIRTMAEGGFEIGSHGMSHRSLTGMPKEEARVDIARSKAVLEENLGVPCDHFAFPFGSRMDYNTSLVACVRESGYHSCALNIHGYNHLERDIFCYKRIIMEETTNIKYLAG